MNRRVGLRRDPQTARDWQQKARERAGRRARERPRAGLKRTGGPRAKRKPPLEQRERQAMAAFYARLGDACENCGYRPEPRLRHLHLEQHHTIRQQTLRSIARSAGLDEVALVWDPDWGMTLCHDPAPNRCHDRHTARVRRVSGAKVPPAAWIAAEALDDELEAAGHPRTGILELRREHP